MSEILKILYRKVPLPALYIGLLKLSVGPFQSGLAVFKQTYLFVLVLV